MFWLVFLFKKGEGKRETYFMVLVSSLFMRVSLI